MTSKYEKVAQATDDSIASFIISLGIAIGAIGVWVGMPCWLVVLAGFLQAVFFVGNNWRVLQKNRP